MKSSIIVLKEMFHHDKKTYSTSCTIISFSASNHYGIAGMYALQAINEGLIGMSFTNTSPFMVPTRAKEVKSIINSCINNSLFFLQPALGTNPLSLGAPGLNGDSFVLDMATTAVAVGKVLYEFNRFE